MERKNRTLLHAIGVVIVFATMLAIFTGISITLMIVGIYWTFQLFFSVAWWAGIVAYAALLVAYCAALRFGLKLLRKGNA